MIFLVPFLRVPILTGELVKFLSKLLHHGFLLSSIFGTHLIEQNLIIAANAIEKTLSILVDSGQFVNFHANLFKVSGFLTQLVE